MNVPANLPYIMPSANQPPIGATVDHYRILSKLGEGGMGVVYEAEDLTLGRRAALKFCSSGRDDPKVRADLLKEARAASSLSHPNIATVYEFVENPGGDPFIAMELVSGTNLRDVLANRHLSVAETLNIATGVAAALAEAHRHSIIHRDIKPGNIHLTPTGDARVLDFGIARTPAPRTPGTETADAPTRTLEGFIGTPLYMSPEQASGEMVDARSDLFSLGAVIYECLAGKAPFAGDTLTSIMARLLTTDPPPPSRLNPRSPAQLDRVVLKLLAKDRRARYQSADELLADLRARTGRASLRPLRWPSRRVLVTALAGLAVAAGVGAPAWWWLAKRHHDPAPAALSWYRDGIADLHYGSYHRASKALQRAVEIDPSYAMAHAYLAEAWYELDYLERAKDELLQAMAPRGSLPEMEALHLDAIRQTVTGEFKAAVEKFQRVSALAAPDARAGALLDLGRAQERSQETKPAMATYAEAVRLDAQNAAAWLRLGALQARTGARQDADRSLDRAENLFQAASNVEGVTECLYVRARFAGTPAQARQLIGKALDAARVTGNDQQQIKLLLLSSGYYLDAGQTAAALDDANRAIEIAHAAGIENLVSRGLIDLGNALFVKGRTAEALRTMQEALDIARRNREKRSEARALVNLGSIRIQTGDALEGWRDVQSALAYYSQGSFRNEAAIALILLGRAARDKGDYDGARRAFAETLTTMQPAGPSLPLALAQEGLASLEALQDRWPQALGAFDDARRTFDAIGNSSGTAINELNVALMHAQLGHKGSSPAATPQAGSTNSVTALQIILMQERFAEARAKAEALLASADAGDRETRRGASLVLGLALARSGAAARGLVACRQAFDLAHAAGNPAAEADALLAAAEAALDAGDRAAAAGYAGRARAFFETSRKPESLWRAGVLLLRSGAPDHAIVAEAAAALAELQASWPAEDFQSYLDRPVIRRMHAELLRANPPVPQTTTR
ncbi:MAG TPA: protein kinase [Bryobacteraceae bacterium]|nr:protein kinase [Bryobacteraceae bacterium]